MIKKRFRGIPKILTLSLASVPLLTTSLISNAQVEGQSRYTLEEVIVTSRKVEEGLQNAPLAVTALSGADIQNRGLLDVSDFASAAPNVSLEMSGTVSGFSAAPRTSIRGIGQGDFVINTDPAVGLYADGVYLGRSLGSVLDLVDVERVEALRGPQGTLFGRNSVGGAINVISIKPSVEDGVNGHVSVATGEGGYTLLRGSVNLPLTDELAARVSVLKRDRDGFIPAVNYDNLELGAEDVTGARIALRWEPTDTFTLDFDADISERDDSPAPMIAVRLGDLSVGEEGLDPSRPHVGRSTSVIGRVYNRENGTPPDLTRLIDQYRTTDAACRAEGAQAYRDSSPTCYGNALASSLDGANSAWWDREGNPVEPEQNLEAYGYAAKATWDLDNFALTSTSSWRGFDSSFSNGSNNALTVAGNNNEVFTQDQFSQEFQITGTGFDDRLDWLAGAYYFAEDGFERVVVIGPLLPPAFAPGNANDPDYIPIQNIQNRYVDNTSKAIFAQGIIHFTPTLDFQLGLRQTEDEKEAEFILFNTNLVDETVFPGDPEEASELNVLVNLSWQMSDDILLYGQYADGFRVGGYPSRLAGDATTLLTYDPEFVDSYEAGIKMETLDGRLRLNAALFLMDYTDIQIAATEESPSGNGGTAPSVDNLGDATISGLELELNFVATDNLRFDAAVGYLNNKIDRVSTGGLIFNAGNNLQKIVTTDNELAYNPEWQANLGVNYSAFMSSGAEIRTRLDYIYEAEQYASIANYEQGLLPSTSQVNANASYIPSDANWQLTIGVRNLTDEENIAAIDVNTGLGNGTFNVFKRGREAYLEFKYSFGE